MSNDTSGRAAELPATDFERAYAAEPFQRLKRTHRGFVFPLGIAFLVWYFAYVLLADYAHELMSTPVIAPSTSASCWDSGSS